MTAVTPAPAPRRGAPTRPYGAPLSATPAYAPETAV